MCICLHILSDHIPELLDTESPPNNLIDDINTVSESKWKRGLEVIVLLISDQWDKPDVKKKNWLYGANKKENTGHWTSPAVEISVVIVFLFCTYMKGALSYLPRFGLIPQTDFLP